MNTVYLVCFVLGLALSLLAAFGGLGRMHLPHTHVHSSVHAKVSGHVSIFNGITIPAFLCWFGGTGYLLHNYSSLLIFWVFALAVVAGLVGASILYGVLFKILIPHERILRPEDTRMEGVLASVSDEIRANGGTGEILFSQGGARRHAAARSEAGTLIPHGTEVVVLRYAKGIAYVSPLRDLVLDTPPNSNLASQKKDAC